MPETKAALIVANWTYEDSDLRQLSAPANDAQALARVLRDPRLCGFEVTTLLNRPSREACEQIERFFIDRKRDDLLLLYFSCHGIKDDDGLLYFAAPDTRLIEHSRPLRSTALSADFVRSVMRASASRRQVLMLDCCYSGAFAGAMLSKGDKSVGVRDHPCKSSVKRKHEALGRARESAHCTDQDRSLRTSASRRWPLLVQQDRTSICCLRLLRAFADD